MTPLLTDRERALARTLAELARDAGGRAYFVGGIVRDTLLGRPCKDIDIELHRLSPDAVQSLLASLGTPLEYGQSFGIYSLKGHSIDIALPRKADSDGGNGSVDPEADPLSCALRRDFTVNAMMQDVLTGEVLDPLGGQEDLRRKVLRATSQSAFRMDPLRVFRCARFASVLGFRTDPATVALASGTDTASVAMERVMGETEKALLLSQRPSIYWESLRSMDQLRVWFPSLQALSGTGAWGPAMRALDAAAPLRQLSPHPLAFMLAALLVHPEADGTGASDAAERFLERITSEKELLSLVPALVRDARRPNALAQDRADEIATNRLFDASPDPETLLLLAQVLYGEDRTGRPEREVRAFLSDRLRLYRDWMKRPFVTGQDLIRAGYAPGKAFSALLGRSHALRLAGVPKEEQLRILLRESPPVP